jgi:hypothetical protein
MKRRRGVTAWIWERGGVRAVVQTHGCDRLGELRAACDGGLLVGTLPKFINNHFFVERRTKTRENAVTL